MRKVNYRKIYESYYGPIPVDEEGRTYEIHHVDGDHSNNTPSNLKAVTIQEHYDIHYAQGDWNACLIMSKRMNVSPNTKSDLARKSSSSRVDKGEHHFLGGKIQTEMNQRRVKDGTHPFLKTNKKYDAPPSNFLTGDKRTDAQKKASVKQSERLKGKPSWNKGKTTKNLETHSSSFNKKGVIVNGEEFMSYTDAAEKYNRSVSSFTSMIKKHKTNIFVIDKNNRLKATFSG